MNTYECLKQGVSSIEAQLCYSFKKKELLESAFTHRSFANEHRGVICKHNERLEFLGDAVLGLLISDFLYTRLPDQTEGELSYLRSRLVEATACARYLHHLDLEKFLAVGKGEASNAGKGRGTILANLFEAIMGALYLDGGMEVAKTFFFHHFTDIVLAILEKPHKNWKAELQDFCQKRWQNTPQYTVIKEEGPDHCKSFHVMVSAEGGELGRGQGSSKKEGEQKAAEDAIKQLGLCKDG